MISSAGFGLNTAQPVRGKGVAAPLSQLPFQFITSFYLASVYIFAITLKFHTL